MLRSYEILQRGIQTGVPSNVYIWLRKQQSLGVIVAARLLDQQNSRNIFPLLPTILHTDRGR